MLDYAKIYMEMHKNDKHFRGRSIRPYVDRIVNLVGLTEPRNMIDWGCGKARQYSEDHVHDRWGGLVPHCYDVGIKEFAKKPDGPFDSVICTDVLEHIAEPDIDEVLNDIFGLISVRDSPDRSFAFLVIGCRPARKMLPDGRNAHLTIKPPQWWNHKLAKFKRPQLIIEGYYDMGKEAQPPLFET